MANTAGFNAFLVGLGLAIFLESGDDGDWAPDYPKVWATFTLGIGVVFVQARPLPFFCRAAVGITPALMSPIFI